MSTSADSTPSVLTQPMSEHRRCFLQIVLVVRSELRGYFGEHFADHWGFFTDRHMCSEIHRFADWVDYPKGDRVLKKYSFSGNAATVSSDGYFVFVGLNDGSIFQYNLLTHTLIRKWDAHAKALSSLAYHSSGLLCSGSRDGTISMWNSFEECKFIRSLTAHSRSVWSMSLNHKGTQIVSSSDDSSICLWSVKTGVCLTVFSGHNSSVFTALFIGDLIISGSKDKEIKIWRPDQSECVRVIKNDVLKYINQVCINSDSTLLAALFFDGFALYKWPEMDIIRTFSKSAFNGQFHPIHPHLLAVGDSVDKSVKIYNVMSEERVKITKSHSGYIWDICFTPDGYGLISVSEDTKTQFWDLSHLF